MAIVVGAFLIGKFGFSGDLASAFATWILTMLSVIAIWNAIALKTGGRVPHPYWMPDQMLGPWFDSLRSSFIVVLFFYGIVLGYFWWR